MPLLCTCFFFVWIDEFSYENFLKIWQDLFGDLKLGHVEKVRIGSGVKRRNPYGLNVMFSLDIIVVNVCFCQARRFPASRRRRQSCRTETWGGTPSPSRASSGSTRPLRTTWWRWRLSSRSCSTTRQHCRTNIQVRKMPRVAACYLLASRYHNNLLSDQILLGIRSNLASSTACIQDARYRYSVMSFYLNCLL